MFALPINFHINPLAPAVGGGVCALQIATFLPNGLAVSKSVFLRTKASNLGGALPANAEVNGLGGLVVEGTPASLGDETGCDPTAAGLGEVGAEETAFFAVIVMMV
jgi:hypothetical protein